MSSAKKASGSDPVDGGSGNDWFGVEGREWKGWNKVIAETREALELDQMQFGHLLGGWSRAQIGRYEAGSAEPQIAFWNAFTRVTSLSLSWVLTGRGKKYDAELQEGQEFQACRNRMESLEQERTLHREAMERLWRSHQSWDEQLAEDMKRKGKDKGGDRVDRAAQAAKDLDEAARRAKGKRKGKQPKRRSG